MSCYGGSPIPKFCSHETAKQSCFTQGSLWKLKKINWKQFVFKIFINLVYCYHMSKKHQWIDVWGHESRNDNPITLWMQQIPGIKIVMIFAVHQMNASTAFTKTDISSIWRLFCYIICIDIEENKINTVKIQQKTEVFNLIQSCG